MNNTALLPQLAEQHYIAPHQKSLFLPFGGINPLVAAAQPLLLLMVALKQVQHMDPPQLAHLKSSLVNEVWAFSETAHSKNCPPRLILAARYCLCTVLDEVVLSAVWGNEGGWSQQTLLSIIQKETWGGERFFVILEEMAKSPKENLHLLELLYILLSLGFEGRHYNQEQSVRDEIKHRLFHLIALHRVEPDKWLSPSLKVLQQAQVINKPRFSTWKIAWVTLGLLLLINIIFNTATYFSGIGVIKEFMAISQKIKSKIL